MRGPAAEGRRQQVGPGQLHRAPAFLDHDHVAELAGLQDDRPATAPAVVVDRSRGSRCQARPCVNQTILARAAPAHRADQRIVGVEHREAVARHSLDDDRLDVGELLDGVDATQAEVVGLARSARRRRRCARSRGPRAGCRPARPRRRRSRRAGSAAPSCADRGPEASERMTSRSSMTTPSVEVMPTFLPDALEDVARSSATVVVLPFVPVTATIGIRAGAPGGNSMSITGFATYCGSPIVGWVCIRKPGAALTSQMRAAGLAYRLGDVGAMKSMPGDVEADDPARPPRRSRCSPDEPRRSGRSRCRRSTCCRSGRA